MQRRHPEAKLRDRHGEPLQQRGGKVTFSEVQRLVEGGAPAILWRYDPGWIQDPGRWWQLHHHRIDTEDRPVHDAWPKHEKWFVPSIWFSSGGHVVVFDVDC